MRSNIYDTRQYASNPNFKECKGKRPKDCSKLGGYLLAKDKCFTTCNKIDEKKICYDKCGKANVRSTFKAYKDYSTSLYKCYDVCAGKIKCPLRYVDCKSRGGYDPKDPCRQTCLKKVDSNDQDTCKTKCFSLTKNMKFKDEAS